jgi:hypothetical protein
MPSCSLILFWVYLVLEAQSYAFATQSNGPASGLLRETQMPWQGVINVLSIGDEVHPNG